MTTETVFFFSALILSIYTAVAKPTKPQKNWLVFIFFLIFITIIRSLGADEDIHRYYEIMQTGVADQVTYWHSEFIFWYSLVKLYEITGSHIVTFLILDTIWIYILLKSVDRLDTEYKLYCALLLFLSFPYFFFYQNVYRQIFATSLFLYAYSIRDRGLLKSDALMLLAFFMHNMIILLYPILLARKCLFVNDDEQKKRLFILATLCVILALAIMVATLHGLLRDGMSTGYDLSKAYIALFICASIYFKYLTSNSKPSLFQISPTAIYAIILLTGLKFLGFESSIIERVGLSLTAVLIIDLALTLPQQKIASPKIYRVALLLFFCSPVYLFPSSRAMLDSPQLRTQSEIMGATMTPITNFLISNDDDLNQ